MISFIDLEVSVPQKKILRHPCSPWLYSNGVMHSETSRFGPVHFVRIKDTKRLGIYNKNHLISVRLLPDSLIHFLSPEGTLTEVAFIEFLVTHLHTLQKKKSVFPFTQTEAYRFVHGDADGLPAIVVDDYHTIFVVQSSSAAGDLLLPYVTKALQEVADKPIFERSTGQIRAMENLPERSGWVFPPKDTSNQNPFEIRTVLAGLEMSFLLNDCQKTGLFLDQRLNLEHLRLFVKTRGSRSLLDICSYAGAWSSAAVQAGLESVTLIDRDTTALSLAVNNIQANAFTDKNPFIETLAGDMFETMQKLIAGGKKFDVVVADPPAFVKSKKHLPAALRAYQRMARLALKLTAPGGISVLCSCSRLVSEEDFFKSLSSAFIDTPYKGTILYRGEQSPCHTRLPLEGFADYLKCYFISL